MLNGVSIPKYFKLSFWFWINPRKANQSFQKIFYVTNGIFFGDCGARWPVTDVLFRPENQFILRHSFECLDEKKRYGNKYERNEEFSAGKWHRIEYQQLPFYS